MEDSEVGSRGLGHDSWANEQCGTLQEDTDQVMGNDASQPEYLGQFPLTHSQFSFALTLSSFSACKSRNSLKI